MVFSKELNFKYKGGGFELLPCGREREMFHLKARRTVLLASLIILMMLLLFSSALAKAVEEAKSEIPSNYVLAIEDGLITLNAKDASLKDIFKELGKRMDIEVKAMVPEEEKITIAFDRLSLEDAIKRLSINYVYLIDSNREEGKITKIVVLPEEEGKGKIVSGKVKKSREEPFKFEFDPSKYK
jgi:hypothetical protein